MSKKISKTTQNKIFTKEGKIKWYRNFSKINNLVWLQSIRCLYQNGETTEKIKTKQDKNKTE